MTKLASVKAVLPRVPEPVPEKVNVIDEAEAAVTPTDMANTNKKKSLAVRMPTILVDINAIRVPELNLAFCAA
jgi:hypothetical protein